MKPSKYFQIPFVRQLSSALSILWMQACMMMVGLMISTAGAAEAVFFTEDFESYTSGAALTLTNNSYLTNVVGTSRIYFDKGGSGTVPDITLFSSGKAFLNTNGSIVGTKNAYNGDYTIGFYLSEQNAAPASPFGGGSNMVLQLQLRESAAGARDGLTLRFYGDGTVSLWNGAVGTPTLVGTKKDLGIDANGAFHLSIDVSDAGFKILVDGVEKAAWLTTYGIENAGYISFGRSANTDYYGTKFASVSVVPEPNVFLLSLCAMVGYFGWRRFHPATVPIY